MVGLHTFNALHSALDTPGMAGADKLLSFMIVKDLQDFVKYVKRGMMKEMGAAYACMQSQMSPPSTLPKTARDQYQTIELKGKRWWPVFLDIIDRVGRCQLLRKHIGKELRFVCKLDSPALYESLTTLNTALVTDVRAHYDDPTGKLYPNGRKPVFPEVTQYLNQCGMNDPFTQIYITTETIPHIALILVCFVIVHLRRFQYDAQTDTLVRKFEKKEKEKDVPPQLDGAPFAIGCLCLLKQFHSEQKNAFVAYLCQFCRVAVSELGAQPAEQQQKQKPKEPPETVPAEVCNCLQFLETFCKYGSIDRKLVENRLPPFLLAKYKEYSARLPRR